MENNILHNLSSLEERVTAAIEQGDKKEAMLFMNEFTQNLATILMKNCEDMCLVEKITREVAEAVRWREMETEKPVPETVVLVCDTRTDFEGFWKLTCSSDGAFYWEDEFGHKHDIDCITHWRHRPKLPQS